MRALVAFASLALALACGSTPREGDDPGECADGADNDRDGTFDCKDADCSGAPACEVAAAAPVVEPAPVPAPAAKSRPAKPKPAPAPKSTVRLSALTGSEIEDGCSCTYRFAPGSGMTGVACSGDVGDEWTRIRADGQLVRLARTSISKDRSDYSGEGFTVTLSTVFVDLCGVNPECESSGRAGNLTVRHGDAESSYPVAGSCGC